MKKSPYEILLYYKYVKIRNPEKLMHEQMALCKSLNLKGRIIIAKEGINGTVEGWRKETKKYIAAMKKKKEFKDMHYKRSDGTGSAFPRLSIKVRDEIVTGSLGKWDVDPNKVTGEYLSAQELHKWLRDKKKKFHIVDMRNDYEYKVGHFRNSILPKLENFRDLPKIIPELKKLKNETVVTVCTGGVRCEKASGYLVKKGFKNVYQLDGGIVTYMEKYPNQDFDGALYVFDNRITMSFPSKKHKHVVIGRCEKCDKKSERYVNCMNLMCHKHFICCEKCSEKNGIAFCSTKCRKIAKLAAAK